MTTPLLLRFVSEARDLLQAAAGGLLLLEKSPRDEAAINEVFRSVHTLKGSVGLFDFPAFTRLAHVAEDLLSVVRDGALVLTPPLVDLLLDALDRMGAWIDDIEQRGGLPADADSVARDTTTGLRAALPESAAAAPAAAAVPPAEAPVFDWVATLPEADRLAAFAAALEGLPLSALEYQPAEDCFFSGEDPLNLFRLLPDLFSLRIEAPEGWPRADLFDPYACRLRFRALAGGSPAAIEPLFRYVIEQVAIAALPPERLVVPAGDGEAGPVRDDFLAAAAPLLAAADWSGLRQAVTALRELTGEGLLLASALRWLDRVLAVPTPDPGWVGALIETIARGHAVPLPPAGGACPAASAPAATSIEPRPAEAGAEAALPPLARALLDSQRFALGLPGDEILPGRLAAIGRGVANLLRALGRDEASWRAAASAGCAARTAAPLRAGLDALLDSAESVPPAGGAEVVPPGAEPADSAGLAGHESRGVARVLKVDQAKVDSLMTLIGELVVSKNSLPFLARRAESVHGSREMAREIKDLYAVIDRLAQEMQAAIMAVRMLPVSEVFERFPRLVRDVARKLGKRVALVIEGEETAADKNIVESLGDPLLHIIRNALDHGIEPPEERVAAGKPAEARLLVRAFQESDQVVIEVHDDGRGIDPVRIRAAAVAKGAISPERAERLSDQEAVNLVFLPGFSTAGTVSDLSGRGVGMDVVATTLEKANGTVSLSSEPGRGTIVRLSLPLSMAVTRVMMVEAGGGLLFGIPMDHIAETVRVSRGAIRRIKQAEAIVLREAIVPLLHLDALLGLGRPAGGDAAEEEAVLVVRLGATLTGLVVDHFREGMDIILKPFDGILAGIPGYAGTALLGDGRVLLVLNLKELL